jgi:hypothetical protein
VKSAIGSVFGGGGVFEAGAVSDVAGCLFCDSTFWVEVDDVGAKVPVDTTGGCPKIEAAAGIAGVDSTGVSALPRDGTGVADDWIPEDDWAAGVDVGKKPPDGGVDLFEVRQEKTDDCGVLAFALWVLVSASRVLVSLFTVDGVAVAFDVLKPWNGVVVLLRLEKTDVPAAGACICFCAAPRIENPPVSDALAGCADGLDGALSAAGC